MTGMARKKVNSAATLLDTPIRSAPTIVAPEREVPGNIAAINWNTPMISAVLNVMSSSVFTLGLAPLFLRSTIMNATPKMMSASATGIA